jgi:hypothetical protein
MTATRTSTGSADGQAPVGPTKPRIGLLGIMQGLYDAMLPGIESARARTRRRWARRSTASPTSSSRRR